MIALGGSRSIQLSYRGLWLCCGHSCDLLNAASCGWNIHGTEAAMPIAKPKSSYRQRLWPQMVSAKGAVDNDFVQSALEKRELLVIELGNEQLRDPSGMDG